MATIIAFPRATTPRRETHPPSQDYSQLARLTQILATATRLRPQAPPQALHTADLSQRLRAIADELDQLCM
ncbi:hypothetical protein [Zoogloea sp.]|uniref:hypothetical protein n=1 Tax=Zoogloea sp. TaxID=49181 RepID=UPI0035AF762E